MTEQRILSQRPPGRTGLRRIEVWIETLLFAGRWLMAPIYLGLLVILGAVAVKFVEELVVTIPLLLSMKEREFVMFVLSLIDLALIGKERRPREGADDGADSVARSQPTADCDFNRAAPHPAYPIKCRTST
jgi:Uncharacterized protein family, UPF0114